MPEYTEFNSKLTPFNFTGYDALGLDDMEIINNGYSAQVTIKESSIGRAYFTGGGYSGKYLASRLHFHWGPSDESGSDHSFKGKFYPAEVHMGHFKEEYGEIFNSINYPDGLTGLAFYYELSEDDEDNPDLEPYISALENIRYEGERQPFGMSFTKFMPDDTSKYYQYNGSMPLPPCLPVVVWTLFKDTSTISRAQLGRLRQLYDSASDATHPDPHLIDGNQRGVQPLGNRTVSRNFHLDDDSEDDSDDGSSNSSNSDNDD